MKKPWKVLEPTFYSMRTLLLQESIYTLKLVRRGHYMPTALQVNLLQVRSARDAMQAPVVSANASDSLLELSLLVSRNPHIRWFLVVDEGQVVGIAPHDYSLSVSETESQAWHSIADVMRHDFIFASEDEKLANIATRMHNPYAAVGVILRRDGRAAAVDSVVGIITWKHIAEIMEASATLFSEYREKN